MSSLKTKTKRGLYWSAAGNFANQGLRFVFGIILARLLAPEAYGVIGMLGVFISLIAVFIDCGFSQALIAKQDRTEVDYATEFWFNIAVGVCGYWILFLSAPLIARFYDMPILAPVLKVIGLGLVVNSLCVVPSAIFSIRLDFKTPATISVISHTISGAVGIMMAYRGYGVWALAFQQIIGGMATAVLYWWRASWMPILAFSRQSFRYLWNYGSKMLGASLIQQGYDNLYPLIIGKCFSASSLGLFSRAQGFAILPSLNVSGMIVNVSFPVLCKIANDKVKLLDVYRRMMRTTAFIVFPMMIGLAAVAEPLVKVILNEKWYGCIVLLQLLCFALVWNPLSGIQINMFKALGRSDIILKLEIIKRSFGVATIVASIPFGVIGMCVGFVIFYVVCFIVNTMMVCRSIELPLLNQVVDILPMVIASILMGLGVLLVGSINVLPIISLALSIFIGIVLYWGLSFFMMKNTMKDAFSMLRRG